MLLNLQHTRDLLQKFDFKTLFIEELGWDRHTATLDVLVDGQSMILNAIAEKRGLVVFVFNGRIPDYPTRRKIERQVAKSAHEHLIIFTDPHKTTQTWQWVKREAGKPTACREHTFHRDQPGDALIQKLQAIAFGLEEEETLTIAHVAGRARAAFDVERVTKRFYERFKTEHAAFLSFIKGIPDDELQRWYASVMLNRLMFIYFIQKKGFLDKDSNYLRTKLSQTKSHEKDRFYRDFLCPLFFEGFAKKPAQRSAAANKLLGNVPYLNGGIFQRHQIEQLRGESIHIADAAFEQLFGFFDQYHWHLDERPLRADNEINPDVLGYIFEKYINQKQMGAYYTKEDITGYIGKYTILPFLFEAARAKCKIAYEGEQAIWRLLQAGPDRYIYDAVKKGVEKPLPLEIAVGLNDVSKRTEWNKPAPEEYALPTEIWREVVARRKRYEEIVDAASSRMLGFGEPDSRGIETKRQDAASTFSVDAASSRITQEKRQDAASTAASITEIGYFDRSSPIADLSGNLPHWRQDGVMYFVTFRLADSLPQEKLRQWQAEQEAWLAAHPEPHDASTTAEYYRLFPARLQAWLDDGYGDCVLAQAEPKEIVEKALKHFAGQRYSLDEFVVMPNHVHVLVTPLGGHELSEILHSWKSYTANEINKLLHRTGVLWQKESFDHIVRSPKQLERIRQYIRDNPKKININVDAASSRMLKFGEAASTRIESKRQDAASTSTFSINDLITYNLDIRQFAQDVIENCEGPELLRALWHSIESITVLDPNCGSGAFLFAALNILEPLYEACLNRMEAFVTDLERSGTKHRPEKFADFRMLLERAALHPNPRHFIFKSIILNNLYGVDLMEEAVEICKLRLFLKLVAQVDRDEQIEPLPDIDFNILAGNTLVGYATYDDVKRAVTSKLDFDNALARIEEKAQDVDRLFALFRQQQTELGGEVTAEDKQKLRDRLQPLEDELNRYLAGEYGVTVDAASSRVQEMKRQDAASTFQNWLASHKPFHWFIEFYGIMKRGGFDVIIGNPPWAEYAKVKKEYTIRNYRTESCGNLHGICTERALTLRCPTGFVSFIVQLPMVSSSRMSSVRTALRKSSSALFVSPFDDRPGKLFEGLQHCRSVIFVSQGPGDPNSMKLDTTRYQRWPTQGREHLFAGMEFVRSREEPICLGLFPKYGSALIESLFCKIKAKADHVVEAVLSRRETSHFIFYQEATQYWVKGTVGLPYYAKNGEVGAPAHGRYLYFDKSNIAHAVCALLNSSLFYAYFVSYGDCFHLSDTLASGFPVMAQLLGDQALVEMDQQLMKDLKTNATRKTINTTDGDKITYDEFYASRSKLIIDEIDRVLAKHYGFTDEELDFIINYDIKYRLGREADGEGEE